MIALLMELAIAGSVIAAVIFWVYSKRKVKPFKRIMIIAAIGLIPLGIFAYVFLTIYFITRTYDFSSSDWRAEKRERWRMADNLTESKVLIGKDSMQIQMLLGSPDQKNDSLHCWGYDMGCGGGGFGARFHTLVLTYHNGRITKVVHNYQDD